MIQKFITDYCIEYWKIENYENAKNDDTQMWVCHHKREIEENKSKTQLRLEGLYYNRPANELIFLTKSEHAKLHGENKLVETKEKQSKSMIGRTSPMKGRHQSEETKHKISLASSGANNGFYGKHHSQETIKKISESKKGKTPWMKGKHILINQNQKYQKQ